MIITWNLVNQKVTNNPPEIHVCDCFLNFAIKYQKTDITLSNFKSGLFKLVDNETELHMIFFFLIWSYDAFFGFTDSGAWDERYNLILDKTNPMSRFAQIVRNIL